MDEEKAQGESKWQKILADYGPYIDDAWKRIYRTAILFIFLLAAGFLGAGLAIKHLIDLFNLSSVTLVTVSPFQFLDLSIDIGLFFAFIFSVPYLIGQLYAFLRPAVSRRERYVFLSILPISFLLFVCGFAYGFFALYLGLKALASLNLQYGLKNYWDIGLFVSQIFTTALLLGILFQFPIIMSILIRLGAASQKLLKKKRRLAYAIITIGVALLPPTDGLSMLIMVLPFVLMYELVILFARREKMAKVG